MPGLQKMQHEHFTNRKCQREEAAHSTCIQLAAQNHLCHKAKGDRHKMKCLPDEHTAGTMRLTAVTSANKEIQKLHNLAAYKCMLRKMSFHLDSDIEFRVQTHAYTHTYMYIYTFFLTAEACALSSDRMECQNN